MTDYYANLFRYTAWADRRVLGALRTQPAAHPEALPLFAHVLAGEHVWLSRIRGVELRVAVWPTLSPDECEALLEENAAGYAELVRGVPADGFGKLIRYRTLKGVEYQTPLGDILTHVVTHGGYHRGQIAKAIGRAGGTSVDTDYIIFVREGQTTPT
jgi:uncharacterized damage-inducible protein DinB